MSVPPPSRPSSTPPSKKRDEGPEEGKVRQKEFKAPEKGKGKEKDKEKKDKGLFDIAAAANVKELKAGVEQKSAELKAEQTEAISAKAQVSQVGQLIQRMVAEMQVGTAGGKEFATAKLAAGSPDVPDAFAGSNLTLSYQDNGLVIRFDNFMTAQNEQNAIFIVESNKDQLAQMIQNLQARNIQVAEMNIGTHSVSLPRVEPLPPPFQPPRGEGGEQGRREGERRRQERREEGR